MKSNITPYQTNIDGTFFVESVKKEVRISFHKILFNDPQQFKMFPFSLKEVFSKDISIQDFEKNGETVTPSLSIISISDNYVFITYSNRKKFDNNLARMLKEGNVVSDTEKYSFEHFLFAMIDFNNNNIVIINNKNASYWKDALELLFQKYGIYCHIVPFKDKDIAQQLSRQKIKKICFTTASKENIQKNIGWSDCNKTCDFIDKCSIELKFSQSQLATVDTYQFVKNNFIDSKQHYSKIQVETALGVIDVIQESITKTATISIPKTHEIGSSQMTEIEQQLFECLQTIKN